MPTATATPAYAVSSHATTFVFDAATYHCTDIQVENTSEDPVAAEATKIDISTLDIAHGGERVFVLSPLTEPSDATASNKTTVNITFWGAAIPPAGVTGTLTTADASGRADPAGGPGCHRADHGAVDHRTLGE